MLRINPPLAGYSACALQLYLMVLMTTMCRLLRVLLGARQEQWQIVTGMAVAFERRIAHLSRHVLEYVEVFEGAVFAPMHLVLVKQKMTQISSMVGDSAMLFWSLRAFYRAKSSNQASVLHSYVVQQRAFTW